MVARNRHHRVPTNWDLRVLNNEFVSYIDTLGTLDGKECLIDWKTTTSRYAEEPHSLLTLDPQLICYSWISGISDVALVVFMRKQQPEIQYLKASISEEQRREFGRLVETTIGRVEAGQFPSHSGIRFPKNGCVSCSHLGLCLNDQQLIDVDLIRKSGANCRAGEGLSLRRPWSLSVRGAVRSVLADRQTEVL
jgi:hypothetical protein